MARYEVPTPSTLLMRLVAPPHATAALRMLDESLPGTGAPAPPGFRVATLSDVSSDSSMTPLAACLVYVERGEPTAWIIRFAVPVPFRRRGLGRRLLMEVSRALQAEGAQRLWIQASDQPSTADFLAGTGWVTAEPPAGFPPVLGASEDGPQAAWWMREL